MNELDKLSTWTALLLQVRESLLELIGEIVQRVPAAIVALVVLLVTRTLAGVARRSAIGSVAIGFAFQDIFKNFLAGVLLLAQEPFRIGDAVIIDKYEGVVEQIEIRTTNLRTYDGELVLVPNSIVFTNPVQVRTHFGKRRTDLAVGVGYGTDLATAAAGGCDELRRELDRARRALLERGGFAVGPPHEVPRRRRDPRALPA